MPVEHIVEQTHATYSPKNDICIFLSLTLSRLLKLFSNNILSIILDSERSVISPVNQQIFYRKPVVVLARCGTIVLENCLGNRLKMSKV